MTPVPTAAYPWALLPDPGTARDWLREELARPEYHESLLDRVVRWFGELLDRIREASATLGGLDPVSASVLLVLVVGLLAWALSRLGRNPGVRAQGATVFASPRLDAAQHRVEAHQALEEGRWDDAVVASVRALAAGLVERALVPEQADVTVHELTGRAAALFPDLAERLEATGLVFDETRYGDRRATSEQARAAADLDREVGRSAPTPDPTRVPATAVPR